MWLYARKQKTIIYRYLRWLNRAFLYQVLLKNSTVHKGRFLMPLSGFGGHGRISPVKMLFIWRSRSKKQRSEGMKNAGMNSDGESRKRRSKSSSMPRSVARMAGIRSNQFPGVSQCPLPRKPHTHWVLKSLMPGLSGICIMMLPGCEVC